MIYYFVDARKWFKGPRITLDLGTLTEREMEALREEGLEIEEVGEGSSVEAKGEKREKQFEV